MKNGGGQTTLWISSLRKSYLKVVLRPVFQIHHGHCGDHLLVILHVLSQKRIITLRNTRTSIPYDSGCRSDRRITLHQKGAIQVLVPNLLIISLRFTDVDISIFANGQQ